jgi:hypothetical protein
MVTSGNVKEYINFLHLKKYSAPATEDLKNRWAALPSHEIPLQLKGLYLHWGIDEITAQQYEKSFLDFYNAQKLYETPRPLNAPTFGSGTLAPQQEIYAVKNQSRNKKSGVVIGIVVGLILIAAFVGYRLLTKEDANVQPTGNIAQEPSTGATHQQLQTAAEPAVQATPAPAPKISPEEQIRIRKNVVRNLLQAEEARDMRGILSCFSPNIQQYWDAKNPTRAELERKYANTWRISSGNVNHDVTIVQVNDNTFDMYGRYEFYSHKDGLDKSINTHVRYVFDNNNKIIRTYGVK